MSITQEKIDRINELAHLAKQRELTAEEAAERMELRREYIEAFRQNTIAALDHTVVQYPDGHQEKLRRKE